MKKKITKIIAITMSVIIAASCFAGCGTKNKNKDNTESFTKIDYLNFMEFPIPTRIYGDKSVMDIYDIYTAIYEEYQKDKEFNQDTAKGLIQEFKHPDAYKLSDYYGNISINACYNEIKEGKYDSIDYCVNGQTLGEWLTEVNDKNRNVTYLGLAYASEFTCPDEEIKIIEDESGKTIIANIEYTCIENYAAVNDYKENEEEEKVFPYYKGKVYVRQDKNRIYILTLGNRIGYVTEKGDEIKALSEEEKNNPYKNRILSEEEMMTMLNNIKIDDDRLSTLYDISSNKKTYGYVNYHTVMESKFKIQKYLMYNAIRVEIDEKFILAGDHVEVYDEYDKKLFAYDFSENKPNAISYWYSEETDEDNLKIQKLGKKWIKISGKYALGEKILTKVFYVYNLSEEAQIIFVITQPYTRDGQKISEKLQKEIEKNIDSCKITEVEYDKTNK